MADANRTPSRSVTLLAELEEEPYSFDFFQAVRRLDCANPNKPPTGQSTRTADDPVRFGQEASMAFAPATLHAVERNEKSPPRLIQRFFGLLGPQGPLPLHITEYVRDRFRNYGDFTFLRFLDVFHHRMIALFYRAWARVRPTVSFDQPESDRFGIYIASLFGHGMRAFEHRDALPDLPKRYFAGILSCQAKHVDGLLAILRGFFCLPVRIEEFVGQWIELPPSSQCLLGMSGAKLGLNTSVGSHVWDCQQKFRVIIGPLTLHQYYRMLPGVSSLPSVASAYDIDAVDHSLQQAGSAQVSSIGSMPGIYSLENTSASSVSLNRLIAAVRSYVGDELQWDLQLILHKDHTPPLGLGIVGRLGWSSWLIRDPMLRDPDDLVLDAMQVPDNEERVELQFPMRWNKGTLGQTREGHYIMATIDSESLYESAVDHS